MVFRIKKRDNSKKEVIIKKIELCKKNKEDLFLFLRKLNENLNKGFLSSEDYNIKLNMALRGKSRDEWTSYYDTQIEKYYKELSSSVDKSRFFINKVFIFLSIIILLGYVTFFTDIGSRITGLSFGIPVESNFSTSIQNETSVEEVTIAAQNQSEIIKKEENVDLANETGVKNTYLTINADKGITISNTFEMQRPDTQLPLNWYIQQGGENQVDDDCVYTGSWKITTDTYTGKQGVMYIPMLDQELGCGLRLPPFTAAKTGYATLSFIFKENFTEKKVQYPSEMVVVNYGYDTCNIYFNNEDIGGYECTPVVTDLGNGWKKITVTDWKITSTSEPIILYTSPHRRLINDYGIIILDDFSFNLK